MGKKIVISAIIAAASGLAYYIGLTRSIVPMKDISLEVLGASLVVLLVFIADELM